MEPSQAAPAAAQKLPAPGRYFVRGKDGIRREIILDRKVVEALQEERCRGRSRLRR